LASTRTSESALFVLELALSLLLQVIRHKTVNTPRRTLSPAVQPADIAGILGGLAKLDLGNRPVLVNHTNILNAVARGSQQAKQVGPDAKKPEVIEISNTLPEPQPALPPRYAVQKARQLELLAKKTSAAAANPELSKLVTEFIRVMQSNSGRTLTRPAFQFLDMLFKQLDDPSVFVELTR
jgi:casein kinase 1